jgi:hypothetical protein
MAIASPDGNGIYCSGSDETLWRLSNDGSSEMMILPPLSLQDGFTFDVGKSGVYFAGPGDPKAKTRPLNLYRFSDRKIVELTRTDKLVRIQLGVSPDEKWLTWTQLDTSVRNLMLVENFR